ncbi:MAG: hypothetical protein KH431_08900 [Erysipelotrichaceae bacterium]|nr:hypothetical protein [Erysipelotrichaceae bacterium]
MKRNFLGCFKMDPCDIRDHMFNEIIMGIQKNGGEILSTQMVSTRQSLTTFFLVLYEDNNLFSEINTFLENYKEITKKTTWHQ